MILAALILHVALFFSLLHLGVSKLTCFRYAGYAWGIASHLNGVKNGDELRAAYEENQPKIVQATMKFSQSKPLYDALVKVPKGLGRRLGKGGWRLCHGAQETSRENSLRAMTLGECARYSDTALGVLHDITGLNIHNNGNNSNESSPASAADTTQKNGRGSYVILWATFLHRLRA